VSGWRVVVFDLDDTLYPEREYVLSGFRAVAGWAADHLGLPEDGVYAELAAHFEAGIRGDTFNRLLTGYGLSDELIPELIRIYRRHTPTLQPFPGIPSLVRELSGVIRLGLVSDGYLEVQQAKFSALGLGGCFSSVVFSDRWGRPYWKPHSRPFQTVLEETGVAPEEAVYVGDNCAKDFLGARRLGMATVWARYSNGDYCVHEPLSPEHAPDFVAHSVEELERLLRGGIAAHSTYNSDRH
jgi:putative hydrolase of the HAD superfamily